MGPAHEFRFSARAAGHVLACCHLCGALRLTTYTGGSKTEQFTTRDRPKDFTPLAVRCDPPKKE